MTEALIEVTHGQFFAVVGPLDVHPSILNAPFHRERGYESAWKLRTTGALVGYSYGGTHLMAARYFLTPAYAPRPTETT